MTKPIGQPGVPAELPPAKGPVHKRTTSDLAGQKVSRTAPASSGRIKTVAPRGLQPAAPPRGEPIVRARTLSAGNKPAEVSKSISATFDAVVHTAAGLQGKSAVQSAKDSVLLNDAKALNKTSPQSPVTDADFFERHIDQFVVVGSGTDRHLKLKSDIGGGLRGAGEQLRQLGRDANTVREFLKEKAISPSVARELVLFKNQVETGHIDDALKFLETLPKEHREALLRGIPLPLLTTTKDHESNTTLLRALISDPEHAPMARVVIERMPPESLQDAVPLFHEALAYNNHEVATLIFTKMPLGAFSRTAIMHGDTGVTVLKNMVAFVKTLSPELLKNYKAKVPEKAMQLLADLHRNEKVTGVSLKELMPIFIKIFADSKASEVRKNLPIGSIPFLNALSDMERGNYKNVQEACKGLTDRFGARALNEAAQHDPTCIKIGAVLLEQITLDQLRPSFLAKALNYGPNTVLAKETADMLQSLSPRYFQRDFRMGDQRAQDQLYDKMKACLINLVDNRAKTGITLDSLTKTIGFCAEQGSEKRYPFDTYLKRMLNNPPDELPQFIGGLHQHLPNNFDSSFELLKEFERPDVFLRLIQLSDPKALTVVDSKTGDTFISRALFGTKKSQKEIVAEAGLAANEKQPKGHATQIADAIFTAAPVEDITQAFEAFFRKGSLNEAVDAIEQFPDTLMQGMRQERDGIEMPSEMAEKYAAVRALAETQLLNALNAGSVTFNDALEILVDRLGVTSFSKDFQEVINKQPEAVALRDKLQSGKSKEAWESLTEPLDDEDVTVDPSLLLRAMPGALLLPLMDNALKTPMNRELVAVLGQKLRAAENERPVTERLFQENRFDKKFQEIFFALNSDQARLNFIRDLPGGFLDEKCAEVVKTSLLALLTSRSVPYSHVLNTLLQRSLIDDAEFMHLVRSMPPLLLNDVNEQNLQLVNKMNRIIQQFIKIGQTDLPAPDLFQSVQEENGIKTVGRYKYRKVLDDQSLTGRAAYSLAGGGDRIVLLESPHLVDAAMLLKKFPLGALYGKETNKDMDLGELDERFQTVLRAASRGQVSNYSTARAFIIGMPADYIAARLDKLIKEQPHYQFAIRELIREGFASTASSEVRIETRAVLASLSERTLKWLQEPSTQKLLNATEQTEVQKVVALSPAQRLALREQVRPQSAVNAPAAKAVAPQSRLPTMTPPKTSSLIDDKEAAGWKKVAQWTREEYREKSSIEEQNTPVFKKIYAILGTQEEYDRLEEDAQEVAATRREYAIRAVVINKKLEGFTPSQRGDYNARQDIEKAQRMIYSAHLKAEMADKAFELGIGTEQTRTEAFSTLKRVTAQVQEALETSIAEDPDKNSPLEERRERSRAYQARMNEFVTELKVASAALVPHAPQSMSAAEAAAAPSEAPASPAPAPAKPQAAPYVPLETGPGSAGLAAIEAEKRAASAPQAAPAPAPEPDEEERARGASSGSSTFTEIAGEFLTQRPETPDQTLPRTRSAFTRGDIDGGLRMLREDPDLLRYYNTNDLMQKVAGKTLLSHILESDVGEKGLKLVMGQFSRGEIAEEIRKMPLERQEALFQLGARVFGKDIRAAKAQSPVEALIEEGRTDPAAQQKLIALTHKLTPKQIREQLEPAIRKELTEASKENRVIDALWVPKALLGLPRVLAFGTDSKFKDTFALVAKARDEYRQQQVKNQPNFSPSEEILRAEAAPVAASEVAPPKAPRAAEPAAAPVKLSPNEQLKADLRTEFQALIPMAGPQRETALQALADLCFYVPESEWSAFKEELKTLDTSGSTFNELEAAIEKLIAKAQEASVEEGARGASAGSVTASSLPATPPAGKKALPATPKQAASAARSAALSLPPKPTQSAPKVVQARTSLPPPLPATPAQKTAASAASSKLPLPPLPTAASKAPPSASFFAAPVSAEVTRFKALLSNAAPNKAETSELQALIRDFQAKSPEERLAIQGQLSKEALARLFEAPKAEKFVAPDDLLPEPAAAEIVSPPPSSPRQAAGSIKKAENVPKASLSPVYEEFASLDRIEKAIREKNMDTVLQELSSASRPHFLITHLNPRLKIDGRTLGEAILGNEALQKHGQFEALQATLLKMAGELAASPAPAAPASPPKSPSREVQQFFDGITPKRATLPNPDQIRAFIQQDPNFVPQFITLLEELQQQIVAEKVEAEKIREQANINRMMRHIQMNSPQRNNPGIEAF